MGELDAKHSWGCTANPYFLELDVIELKKAQRWAESQKKNVKLLLCAQIRALEQMQSIKNKHDTKFMK